jgi:uncharacterized protein
MFLKRLLLSIAGFLSLALAIIGIVLPLIPTTPLLLLAAACFIRSSSKAYEWLITNKYLGPYIKNYRDGKGIPLSAKVIGITLLWISMLYTIIFVVPLFVIKIMLAGTAAYFTWFILKQKTMVKALE